MAYESRDIESADCGLERVTRIELALSAWEADVLPLNYTRGGRERPLTIMPERPPAGHRREPGLCEARIFIGLVRERGRTEN